MDVWRNTEDWKKRKRRRKWSLFIRRRVRWEDPGLVPCAIQLVGCTAIAIENPINMWSSYLLNRDRETKYHVIHHQFDTSLLFPRFYSYSKTIFWNALVNLISRQVDSATHLFIIWFLVSILLSIFCFFFKNSIHLTKFQYFKILNWMNNWMYIIWPYFTI